VKDLYRAAVNKGDDSILARSETFCRASQRATRLPKSQEREVDEIGSGLEGGVGA